MDALIAEQKALCIEYKPELAVLQGEFSDLKNTLSPGTRQRASSQPAPAKHAVHSSKEQKRREFPRGGGATAAAQESIEMAPLASG